MKKIPFVDLNAQYLTIKFEIDRAIQSVIDESAFIRGRYVEEFEEKFGAAHEGMMCLSCANGTDALYISLKALDVGMGDEVITTAVSWISTSQTITQTGAKVVFVDIDPKYFTIDPMKIEEKITEKTKAIIPVHLYGQPADMDAITRIADNYGIYVLEDCAQAHFAEDKGRKVGTFGIAGTFSFYPGKNLGAYGDAGAIISNDLDFMNRARMFAHHGAHEKHRHKIEGINSRMDGIQAAILSVKLRYIDEWTGKRTARGLAYNELLKEFDVVEVPSIRENCSHVFHLYVVQSKNRDLLKSQLEEHGISCQIHYPIALPFLEAYRYLGHQATDFPIAARFQTEILSLPLYPELTTEMLHYVAEKVRDCSI
jgi:dTDP-4-amino-4,6-dideoxygalactose transaminase